MLNTIKGMWFAPNTRYILTATILIALLLTYIVISTSANPLSLALISKAFGITLLCLTILLAVRHSIFMYDLRRYRTHELKSARRSLEHCVSIYAVHDNETLVLKSTGGSEYTHLISSPIGLMIIFEEGFEDIYNTENMRNERVPILRKYTLMYYPRIVAVSIVTPDRYSEDQTDSSTDRNVEISRSIELDNLIAPTATEIESLVNRIEDSIIYSRGMS